MSAKDEEDKLGWMYKNSSEVVDREEYLLGRRLDKNLDSESNKNETESIPGSIFSLPETSNKVDALRKIKEDPLEAIKEKEREMRKELLKNPIQMKKLKQMYEAQRRKTDDSKNKKKKKKSKDKNKFENDSALDALLSKKLAKLIKTYGKDQVLNSDDSTTLKRKTNKSKKDKKSKSDSSSSSSSSESSQESSEDSDSDRKKPRNTQSDKKTYKSNGRHTQSRRRSSSYSSSEESDTDERRRKKAKNDSKHAKEHSRELPNKKKKESVDSRYRSSSPKEVKTFGLYVPKGARKARSDVIEPKKKGESPQRSRDRSRDKKRNRSRERVGYSGSSRDSRRDRSRSRDKGRNKNKYNRTHLSQEEKEKKLKEMMDNVSWRNDLMDKNSHRHKEQLKKEESQPQDFNEDFARNQLSKSIYSDTVEKRIKSNLQNIQRSSFAMDRNFAKR